MKVVLNILLITGFFLTFGFSKELGSNSKKLVHSDSLVMMGTIKYSQGYKFTESDGNVERKRSHKRRRAVRKPRRGRGA